MPYLTLFAGLILPWAVGYVWLANVESAFGDSVREHRLRRTGYGFFLGYAILYAVVLINSRLTGNVSYFVVMLSLTALMAAGGLLLNFRKQAGQGLALSAPLFRTYSRFSRPVLGAL